MPGNGSTLREFLARDDTPCPRCGYNLRGLSDARCPECGLPLTIELLNEAWPILPSAWGVAFVPLLLLAIVAAPVAFALCIGGLVLLAQGRYVPGSMVLTGAVVSGSLVALELWWVRRAAWLASAPPRVLWACAIACWALLTVTLALLVALTTAGY